MRHTMRKFALAAALVLAAAGGMTVSTAGTASASGWGCSGNEVSGSPYPVTTPYGATFSYVHLFYDPSTGRNCAVNVKTGSLYGTASYTSVELDQCLNDNPGQCYVGDSEFDPHDPSINYSYYAGPVSVYGSGHCISLEAETDDTSGNYASYRSPMGFHC